MWKFNREEKINYFVSQNFCFHSFSVNIDGETANGDAKTFKIVGLTSNTKVKQLRMKVAPKVECSAAEVVLEYNNVELQDGRTLGYYKIGNGSTVNAECV